MCTEYQDIEQKTSENIKVWFGDLDFGTFRLMSWDLNQLNPSFGEP